jgi:hypothetical protein
VVNRAVAASVRSQRQAQAQIVARVLAAASQHDTLKKCTFHGHFFAVADFCCAAASAPKSLATAFCR